MESAYLLIPIALGAIAALVGLGGLLFSRRKWGFFAVFLLGGAAAAAPYGYNWYVRHFTPLGPLKRHVDGEWHLTLTGWNKSTQDYALLAAETDLAVLQMANPDVTDEIVGYLEKMTFLKELDVSDSQITDEGLARIARLPSLEILRLKATKITDEGFRTHLMPRDWILHLDVRNTSVKRKTIVEWTNIYPDKRKAVY